MSLLLSHAPHERFVHPGLGQLVGSIGLFQLALSNPSAMDVGERGEKFGLGAIRECFLHLCGNERGFGGAYDWHYAGIPGWLA